MGTEVAEYWQGRHVQVNRICRSTSPKVRFVKKVMDEELVRLVMNLYLLWWLQEGNMLIGFCWVWRKKYDGLLCHYYIYIHSFFPKPSDLSPRIYSFHAQIARPSATPPPPPFPPPPTLAFDQNQAPESFKTRPSPHRLFDLQGSLDKRIHFPPQLSDFVPLRNGFYSFRAQTD